VQVNVGNVSFWRIQPMAETQRKELSVSSQQFKSKKVQAVAGALMLHLFRLSIRVVPFFFCLTTRRQAPAGVRAA
jgi:hypothetical protein